MGGRRSQATESTIKVLALVMSGQVLVYSTLCMGIDEIGQSPVHEVTEIGIEHNLMITSAGDGRKEVASDGDHQV